MRPTRLAAIEPDADDWWNPAQRAPADRDAPGLPDLAQTKAYLLDTLESTLELLEHAAETDAGLYFYRLALFHEDLRGEQLLVMAQTLGLPLKVEAAAGRGDAAAALAARHAVGARPGGGWLCLCTGARHRARRRRPNSRSMPSP